MRFRHRSVLSQSALPAVSPHQNTSGMKLASLQENQNTPAKETERPEIKESARQSRELEALLLKLNGNDAEYDQQPQNTEEEADYGDDLSQPFQSLDVDMSAEYDESNVSLDNSFFGEGTDDSRTSAAIPVGSGSFARVPSGGFHLVVDSIKSACKNTVARIRGAFSKNKNTSRTTDGDKKRRNQFIASAVIAAVIALVIVVAVSGGNDEQKAPELAAQTTVGGNDDFAILPIEEEQDIANLKFDADDFSIPDLDFAMDDEADPEAEVVADKQADSKLAIEAAKAEAKRAAEAAAAANSATTAANTKTASVKTTASDKPAAEAVVAAVAPTEARMYGRNDNVLASNTAGDNYKTKRSCVMREGPASRFGLVKEISAGTTIKILANTEEDWILQDGGVWTKAGQPSKLGPGSKFANATKGMSVPQPKSRVISANNWRYIQVGKLYGYVGPACFK